MGMCPAARLEEYLQSAATSAKHKFDIEVLCVCQSVGCAPDEK